MELIELSATNICGFSSPFHLGIELRCSCKPKETPKRNTQKMFFHLGLFTQDAHKRNTQKKICHLNFRRSWNSRKFKREYEAVACPVQAKTQQWTTQKILVNLVMRNHVNPFLIQHFYVKLITYTFILYIYIYKRKNFGI